MHRYTVVEHQNAKLGWQVFVYDETNFLVADLTEKEIDMCYRQGIFTEQFGSYKFKQQVEKFLTKTA